MFPRHPDAEHLSFYSSTIGKPQFDEHSIRVKVRDLWVGKGFQGLDEEVRYKEITVIFEDVVKSERHYHEYVPGSAIVKRVPRRGFKGELYTIVDGPFAEVTKPIFWFELGPISHDPDAFISWEIRAASVRVEDGVEY